jgi:hypothetical protein
MKKSTTATAPVQGMAPVINPDLMAMFQAFVEQQSKVGAMSGLVVTGNEVAGIKSAPKVEAPAKVAKVAAKKAIEGVHIHELENSFFVYGEAAPAKLAEFFKRKPHLDRGFKEREIKGLGVVKAYWFGGRQIAKIRKEITK